MESTPVTKAPEPTLTPAHFRDTLLTRELVYYGIPFNEIIPLFGQGYIMAALELHKGNRAAAARWLGIHRNTLQRHIRGLVPPGHRGNTGQMRQREPGRERRRKSRDVYARQHDRLAELAGSKA